MLDEVIEEAKPVPNFTFKLLETFWRKWRALLPCPPWTRHRWVSSRLAAAESWQLRAAKCADLLGWWDCFLHWTRAHCPEAQNAAPSEAWCECPGRAAPRATALRCNPRLLIQGRFCVFCARFGRIRCLFCHTENVLFVQFQNSGFARNISGIFKGGQH